eukprot:scaffold18871_cov69-Phaeocystis_antarctica.AAC.10
MRVWRSSHFCKCDDELQGVARRFVLVRRPSLREVCGTWLSRGLASLLTLPSPPASGRLHLLCLLHTALFIELGPPRFIWLGLGLGLGLASITRCPSANSSNDIIVSPPDCSPRPPRHQLKALQPAPRVRFCRRCALRRLRRTTCCIACAPRAFCAACVHPHCVRPAFRSFLPRGQTLLRVAGRRTNVSSPPTSHLSPRTSYLQAILPVVH